MVAVPQELTDGTSDSNGAQYDGINPSAAAMDAVAHTYDDGQDSCGDEEGHFDAGDNVTCVRHDGKKASMRQQWTSRSDAHGAPLLRACIAKNERRPRRSVYRY
jgi:hypothetical protein